MPPCWTWSPRPSQACLGPSGSGTAHCGPADHGRNPGGEREEGKSAPEDFLAFACEKVKAHKRRGQIGTFRSYRTTCRKFTAFIEETYGREEVSFGALEAELFREFRTYCYEKRGSGTNTAQRELSVLYTLHG
ncbi:phage integrase SAM-like domain-containing protein [Salinibacter ruber]|uniref:phage integrase SAM-like domain-containing protein n=1 Tax=Salinibacter ruber TaxID=146919 RepID=UPI002167B1DD|nr:phage integrase SAM-like domain-containing protein [Salinibacter ruber]MCS4058447.1 hypothetical protein [Salinibacter ruber]